MFVCDVHVHVIAYVVIRGHVCDLYLYVIICVLFSVCVWFVCVCECTRDVWDIVWCSSVCVISVCDCMHDVWVYVLCYCVWWFAHIIVWVMRYTCNCILYHVILGCVYYVHSFWHETQNQQFALITTCITCYYYWLHHESQLLTITSTPESRFALKTCWFSHSCGPHVRIPRLTICLENTLSDLGKNGFRA